MRIAIGGVSAAVFTVAWPTVNAAAWGWKGYVRLASQERRREDPAEREKYYKRNPELYARQAVSMPPCARSTKSSIAETGTGSCGARRCQRSSRQARKRPGIDLVLKVPGHTARAGHPR